MAGDARIGELARRHGVSEEAARALLEAVRRGGGAMAQFDIPELGGMGQWSRGGMTQVGDMFDDRLKAKVDALASDLAALGGEAPADEAGDGRAGAAGAWWPEGLGRPSATGGQGSLRYAVFPEARRLAVERDGRVTLHDTEGRVLSGVSQAGGGAGGSSLAFTGPDGPVRVEDLPEVDR